MHVWLILSNELKLARRDPALFVILFAMPVITLYLAAPAMRPALLMEGYEHASGAEQAMPGMSVLFGNFGMAFLAFSIFREHTWGSWDRLLYTPVSYASIFLGKAITPFALVFLQQILMLGAAAALFGVRLTGDFAAYALVSGAFAFFVVSAGFLFTALFSSMQKINAVINAGSLVFAGIGGAFAPLETLPAPMQAIAFLSPNYWAIQALRGVILDGAGLAAVAPAAVILTTLGLVCLGVAVLRFNGEGARSTWA